MAMTAAERQKKYRERNGRNAGKRRINLVVAEMVAAKLDELATSYGVYKQVMLERVIVEYKSLRRNDEAVVLRSPREEAELLLQLAGGDVAEATALLSKKAEEDLPGFTWRMANDTRALPEYKRFRQIRRCLCDHPPKPVQPSATVNENVDSHPKSRSTQLTFEF